jgi:hypothetical protein
MPKYLQVPIEFNMGIEAQSVLLVDHMLESLFTTNLLVPSLVFKYYTFLLEFMKKDNFP